jgi:hypothetical protein
MKTDYSVIGKTRNQDNVRKLIAGIRAQGKTCYDFTEQPADPANPTAPIEDQMRASESHPDFLNDPYHKEVFERDLEALRSADTVVLLLPAGTSAHIEAGIAYGLGKELVLIGEPEKPETLYFIYNERYQTTEEFLKTI